MVAPKNLSSTFIVMQPDQSAVPVEVSPTVFEELDRRFDGDRQAGIECS